jgi:hypothetical protein
MTNTSSFTGPLTFDRSTYYSPSKSYINNKKIKKEKIDPKQKVASLFYNFYINNIDTLPSKYIVLKHRNAIENLMLRGCLPEEAFEKILPKKI